MKRIFVLLLAVIFSGTTIHCSRSRIGQGIHFDEALEKKLTLNPSFPAGDVRRYGIFPEKSGMSGVVKITKIDSVLKLASSGLELYFPPGYYNRYILIEKAQNMSLRFDNVQLGSALLIRSSENIRIKGKLTSYNTVEIKNARNIHLDSILIINNPERHSGRRASAGMQILEASENVHIKFLYTEGLGSGKSYRYTHAALKIYGYPKLPQQIEISKAHIKNASVHGAIIMGDGIQMDTLIVEGYALHPNPYLVKLSNVKQTPGNYYAVWFQKNTGSEYGLVDVPEIKAKAIRLGPGNIYRPTVIHYLKLPRANEVDALIDDDLKTNIVVRNLIFYPSDE